MDSKNIAVSLSSVNILESYELKLYLVVYFLYNVFGRTFIVLFISSIKLELIIKGCIFGQKYL